MGKQKEKESGGISAEERKELDKLKEDVIARKKDLKAEGMTGGQMNKDAQIVAWVKRMNELKEKAGELEKKEDKKKEKKSKGDPEALENLKKEIEAYKERLKSEFGYTKADINKDEDIIAMTKKLKEMKAYAICARMPAGCATRSAVAGVALATLRVGLGFPRCFFLPHFLV